MCYLIKSQENVNNEVNDNKGMVIGEKLSEKNLSTSNMETSPKNIQQSFLGALSFNSLHSTQVCFLCRRSSSSNISLKESLIDKIIFFKPTNRLNHLVQCDDCSNLVCQSCGSSTTNDFKKIQNVSFIKKYL